METQDELRQLIKQYRERLAEGGGAVLIKFVLDAIAEAERKLSAADQLKAPDTVAPTKPRSE